MSATTGYIRRLLRNYPGLGVLAWTVPVVIAFVFAKYTQDVESWLIYLLPFTITELGIDWWKALGLTICASIVACIFGVVVGYITGVYAVASSISTGDTAKLRRFLGVSIDVLYRFVYVIPFVLTVNIAYNGLFYLQSIHNLPRWLTALAIVAVAGSALGGYKVFMAIFAASSEAKTDSVVLVRSLYSRGGRSKRGGSSQGVLSFRQSVSMALRLRDCEIPLFSRGLEDALHLSIVSVMIVESVLPAFYENVFVGSGVVENWAGGVGRMILAAQQSMTPKLISGILWTVLIFDGVATAILRQVCRWLWHRHYRSDLGGTQ